MFLSFSSGITIGSAAAAFLTLLRIVPRLMQLTKTKSRIKLYEYTIVVSSFFASLIYFTDFSLNASKYISLLIAIAIGIFYGLFASALAEVLNVIPVFVKKFKAKHQLKYIIGSLVFGKVVGALYYWLIFKKS